jgi:hypothetical protein
LIGGMAQHRYLGRGVPHKVITWRKPADCESQDFAGRAHLAARPAIHEIASMLKVSGCLIVVAATKEHLD